MSALGPCPTRPAAPQTTGYSRTARRGRSPAPTPQPVPAPATRRQRVGDRKLHPPIHADAVVEARGEFRLGRLQRHRMVDIATCAILFTLPLSPSFWAKRSCSATSAFLGTVYWCGSRATRLSWGTRSRRSFVGRNGVRGFPGQCPALDSAAHALASRTTPEPFVTRAPPREGRGSVLCLRRPDFWSTSDG